MNIQVLWRNYRDQVVLILNILLSWWLWGFGMSSAEVPPWAVWFLAVLLYYLPESTDFWLFRIMIYPSEHWHEHRHGQAHGWAWTWFNESMSMSIWDSSACHKSGPILGYLTQTLAGHCNFLGLSWWPQIVSTWQIHRRESHCITFIYLVPDDSWYLGLALSFGIRSKALTVEEIWQFKVFTK